MHENLPHDYATCMRSFGQKPGCNPYPTCLYRPAQKEPRRVGMSRTAHSTLGRVSGPSVCCRMLLLYSHNHPSWSHPATIPIYPGSSASKCFQERFRFKGELKTDNELEASILGRFGDTIHQDSCATLRKPFIRCCT